MVSTVDYIPPSVQLCEIIRKDLGLKSFSITHRSYGEPEYKKWNGDRYVHYSCPRVDWEKYNDDRRYFMFAKPVLKKIKIPADRFMGLKMGEDIFREEEDLRVTLDEIVKVVKESL